MGANPRSRPTSLTTMPSFPAAPPNYLIAPFVERKGRERSERGMRGERDGLADLTAKPCLLGTSHPSCSSRLRESPNNPK